MMLASKLAMQDSLLLMTIVLFLRSLFIIQVV